MYHTDRVRIGSVAAMLSTILVVHQTQAQNAPRASWMFPTASAFNRFALAPKEVLGHFAHAEGKNIGKNKNGEISSADGSGSVNKVRLSHRNLQVAFANRILRRTQAATLPRHPVRR